MDPNFLDKLFGPKFFGPKFFEAKLFGPKFFGPEFFEPNFLDLNFLDSNILDQFIGSKLFGPEIFGPKFLGPKFLGPIFWDQFFFDQFFWTNFFLDQFFWDQYFGTNQKKHYNLKESANLFHPKLIFYRGGSKMWKDSIRNIVVIFQTTILRIARFYVRCSAHFFAISFHKLFLASLPPHKLCPWHNVSSLKEHILNL